MKRYETMSKEEIINFYSNILDSCENCPGYIDCDRDCVNTYGCGETVKYYMNETEIKK